MGWWTTCMMAAMAVPPLIAGVVLEHAGWRWIFLLPVRDLVRRTARRGGAGGGRAQRRRVRPGGAARSSAPMLPPSLFRSPAFTASTLAALISFLGPDRLLLRAQPLLRARPAAEHPGSGPAHGAGQRRLHAARPGHGDSPSTPCRPISPEPASPARPPSRSCTPPTQAASAQSPASTSAPPPPRR
ncbi:hypothetical protein [Nonomuraea sp. NPDC049504]|uniref:hypothetical protein n=1 Tax=Nonomuraea sp. NPDC049504 TaxID=3154729 RepID=UPI003429B913